MVEELLLWLKVHANVEQRYIIVCVGKWMLQHPPTLPTSWQLYIYSEKYHLAT